MGAIAVRVAKVFGFEVFLTGFVAMIDAAWLAKHASIFVVAGILIMLLAAFWGRSIPVQREALTGPSSAATRIREECLRRGWDPDSPHWQDQARQVLEFDDEWDREDRISEEQR